MTCKVCGHRPCICGWDASENPELYMVQLENKVKHLEDKVHSLRQALKDYGQHSACCATVNAMTGLSKYSCQCGLGRYLGEF